MPRLPEPSSTQTPQSIGEPSALKTPSTSTRVPSVEEMLARGCAWPLPITPMNTDGQRGRNKVAAGQVFGRLQIVAVLPAGPSSVKKCRCACLCGNFSVVTAGQLNLASQGTKSCGCLTRDTTIARSTKHGYSPAGKTTKVYWVWADMVGRCHSPTHKRYADYGGRGITVCDKWREFSGFLADMGDKPDKLSIERIDNNLGYGPGNCKWATMQEQSHNKRNNTLSWEIVNNIRADKLPHKTLADKYGIYHGTIGKVKRNEIWIDNEYLPTLTSKKRRAT